MSLADSQRIKRNLSRSWRRLATVSAAIIAIGALAGCGATSARHATSQPTLSATQPTRGLQPVVDGDIAARIAGHAITVAAFNQALTTALEREPIASRPVPPNYTACISSRRGESGAAITPTSVATLKSECEGQYAGVREEVLGGLISAIWVFGEARELGVDASRDEITRLVGRTSYTYAGAREHLDAEAIRRAIGRKVGPMTTARLASYYQAHERLYTIPEKRDLRIVRTKTTTGALAVMREITAGTTFAEAAQTTVAHDPRLQQPIDSKEGLVRGLKPGVYNEPALDHAIFNAKLGALAGPVNVATRFPGSFVFQVTKIVPARQRPFAQVAATLRKELPEQLYQRALVAFIKGWRTKWRARTDCRPGFVVLKCRQYKHSGGAGREDPTALA